MALNKKLEKDLEDKMKKEMSSLKKMLQGFAKESIKTPGDWDTKFPDFKAEGTLDEEADEVEEYSSLLPIERTLETKLQNIKEALEKMKKSQYGKCESCGKDIESKRLQLIPETKTCDSCKQ